MPSFRPGLRTFLPVMTALLVASAAPAPALGEEPVPDSVTTSRLGSPEVFGYLTYWDLDAQIDYEAITTIAYFGLAAGADGRLVRRNSNGTLTTEYSRWRGARVDAVIQQAHAHGVKFVLTVERMAWSDGTRATTRALLGNPAARTTLVGEIVGEVVSRGLDGVTLDFEPILSDTRDQFAALLAELRAALDAVNPDYQLTFAATGSAPALTYRMYGTVTAAGWADAVLIMAYPLRALDASIAGGLAPLYSPTSYDLKQVTRAYLEYVAPDKIVMLLPWYGREWPTETADQNARVQSDAALYDRPRNLGYALALPYAVAHGRRLDTSEMSAWTVFRKRHCADCPETWQQIYYDDVETLGFKYDWAIEQGLAGIGIWALGYDNDRPELWKLLRTKFGGFVDADAPSGSLAVAGWEGGCEPDRIRLALSADDGPDGSGSVFVRLSDSPEISADGLLAHATTYPAASNISWPLDVTAGDSPGASSRTVYAQWRDVAGNWSSVSSLSFDDEMPGQASVSLKVPEAVTLADVTVQAEQLGGPPVTRVLLSNSAETVDGILAHAVVGAVNSNITLSLTDRALGGTESEGPRTIHAQWQDEIGCWSEPVSAHFVLDRTAPAGTLSLLDPATLSTTGEVQVLAPATDATSAVATVELSNDGATWQPFAPSDAQLAWTAGELADGPWTIHARWTDTLGNVSAPQSVSLLLDRRGPVGSLTINGGTTFTNVDRVTIDAPGTDTASSVSTVRVSSSADLTDGRLAHGIDFAPGQPIAWQLGGPGGAAPDGMHTVYAQWQDSVGRWSDVASATIRLDRTPPTLSVPTTSLQTGRQLGTSTVPVAVRWTALDSGSGLVAVRLESSRASGAWKTHATTLTATGSALSIDTSAAWRVRVTAADAAGNSSTRTTEFPVRASVVQDGARSISYSGRWTRVARDAASGGSVRYSRTANSTATYTFTGRSVAWVAAVGPELGRARVSIDGRVVATVDLGGSRQQRRLVFSRNWSRAGKHTIRIRVLGTPGRPRVELDGFVVLT